MLRRVTKQEYQAQSNIRSDAIGYCLECWRYHMSGTQAANLSARPMGGLTANEDGYGHDPFEAQLAHDAEIGAATNACIESLKHRHKWAVYSTLGIGEVIKFNFIDLIQTYDEAKTDLERLLKKNPKTSYLF